MSLLGPGLAGDIWSTGAFSFESPLKDLLDSGEFTIEQLLAEDELLQEVRGMHPQLIAYFSTPEAVTKLVQYVILPSEESRTDKPTNGDKSKYRDPGQWLEEHQRKKEGDSRSPEKDPEIKHVRFPYMACEIICCEINAIIDVLVDGTVPNEKQEDTELPKDSAAATEGSAQSSTRILDLLFSVLYDTAPGELDDYRAGYFDKILTVLFRKRPEDLVKYINEGGSRGADSLMQAVFSHLYSHSIMQIAQRLMLPQRPTPPQQSQEENGAEIIAEEQAFDQDLAVYCDWSQSSHALELLLGALIEPKVPIASSKEDESDEFLLDLSLHASEVLITVIQNSMLSSETMLSLTKPETVERLVLAATSLRTKESEEPYFCHHESLLTSAMNVLESLILQLGGYGAVGTMFLLPDDEGGQLVDGEINEDQQHLIADLGSVVGHLPLLLNNLSGLLRHSSTKKWTSFMQFSTTEPEQLLGNSRLRIVRVLESLVLLGDPDVDSKLVESDCLEICLELFWEFQWCSMLHQSVANLLVHVFEGQNARVEMQEYFLIKCNLLGRLMDSFSEPQANETIEGVSTKLDNVKLSDASDDKEKLAVSEDDVDAALERQESQVNSSSPSGQPFRFGYMGHVIIICQALVHACTNEPDPQDEMQTGEAAVMDNQVPLMLAELVTNHPLADKWNTFVNTALTSETTVQSTPLGGYGAGNDPLHSHRPGLVDDGDILGDDGMGPPAPPRGIGGIDMDENDLDVAASLVASLGLNKPPQFSRSDSDDGGLSDAGSMESGDSDKSYNSGETASEKTGYAFDDPLGKAGSLGIELGKLTKYGETENTGGNEPKGGSAEEVDDEVDDSSGSSSDEAPESPDKLSDPPVMDLFAGNFDYSQNEKASNEQAAKVAEFTNFANFDEAGDEFGDFESATPSPSSDAANAVQPPEEKVPPEVKELFESGTHADLLENEDPLVRSDATDDRLVATAEMS